MATRRPAEARLTGQRRTWALRHLGSWPWVGQRRRRVLGGLSLGLAALGLSDFWRYSEARTPPEPPDDRPRREGPGPVLFVGHGSPMNALQDNAFTRRLRGWGRELGLPPAILVVSAHWLTEGGHAVSIDDENPTLHDFGGFPPELHAQAYPAPGAAWAADGAAQRLAPRRSQRVSARGLDHGAWTVLKHLYPAANVPVAQLSIDITRDGAYQVAVGRAIAALRAQGVMILGSGNVVHNLGDTRRGAADTARGLTDWADGFDQAVKAALLADDRRALADPVRLHGAGAHAVPTPDHYHPMLVALGAAQAAERPQMVFEGFQAGTLSMRCVQWG